MTEIERIKRNMELKNISDAFSQGKYDNLSSTFQPMIRHEVKKNQTWDEYKSDPSNIVNADIPNPTSRTFASGSKRDANDDKPRIADIDPYSQKRQGYHFLKGSKYYGEGNFELGQPTKSSWESLLRHITDYRMGDRSEDHLSAVEFGMMMIKMNEQREGIPADHYYQLWKSSPAYQEWLKEQEVKSA